MPRRWIVAAAALVAVVLLAYWGRRLWLKSDDLLRPVVVLRGADAVSLVQPSLGARFHALFGKARAPADLRPKLVALTFDDGPYPIVTPLLLQTLRDAGVPATFFLIGRDAEQYPDLARAIAAGGHEIADHTLTHPDLDRLSDAAVVAELRDGAASLERIAPDPAERRLFRPPHGRFNAATLRAAQSAGFDTILWSDDPGDWRSVPADVLRDHVLAHAVAPEILLLHSGRQATVAALPALVDRFRRAGFTFVTVSALLRQSSAEQLNRPAKVALDDA
ncbi:MAG: polysaccharide deacetylase family protein [Candidatus Eremiobacteraeota bacterium]|nr:polysaccharide deacetylase family protein [Candidatus Eremiobacteraeota bacterium]